MEYVNYDAAKQKANSIYNIAEQVNGLFNEAMREIDEKIGNQNVWSGAAAADFKSKWNEFTNEFNVQLQHILTIQDKIEYTRAEMHRAEQEMQNASNAAVSDAMRGN